MKRKIALLLVAVMTAATLAGCGASQSSDGGSATAPAEEKPSSEAAASGEVLEVDFWSAPNQGQYEYWEAKANAFNAEGIQLDGKTVQVKVQQMPETPSSEAGIQNAIATGTAPAVSENINRGFAATLSASDVVYDITNESWFQEIIEARSMQEAITNWAIDGKQYVIPVYVNPMVWQWNYPALQALGFDKAPETVDEFTAVIKAFADKKSEMDTMGVTHTFYRPSLSRPDQWWDRWFDFLMIYNGLSQAAPVLENGEIVMDKAAAVEAMEIIGTFGETVQQGELGNLWLEENNSVLVTINAPWNINNYTENGINYGEHYIYGPSLVKKAGDKPYNYADAKGLTFYKADNVSEEEHLGAVEFVKWIYSAENSADTDLGWLNKTNMLPVRGDLNSNPAFADVMNASPALSALAQWLPYAIPGLATDKDSDLWTAFTELGTAPYMNEVMASPAGSAPDATSYIDAAIDGMKAVLQ